MKPYVLHAETADGLGFVITVNGAAHDHELVKRLFDEELKKEVRAYEWKVPPTFSRFKGMIEIGGFIQMSQWRCRGLYKCESSSNEISTPTPSSSPSA